MLIHNGHTSYFSSFDENKKLQGSRRLVVGAFIFCSSISVSPDALLSLAQGCRSGLDPFYLFVLSSWICSHRIRVLLGTDGKAQEVRAGTRSRKPSVRAVSPDSPASKAGQVTMSNINGQ